MSTMEPCPFCFSAEYLRATHWAQDGGKPDIPAVECARCGGGAPRETWQIKALPRPRVCRWLKHLGDGAFSCYTGSPQLERCGPSGGCADYDPIVRATSAHWLEWTRARRSMGRSASRPEPPTTHPLLGGAGRVPDRSRGSAGSAVTPAAWAGAPSLPCDQATEHDAANAQPER